MNYALVFRKEVREELDEAYSWYESQQQGLGDEFLDCVDEMLNRICQSSSYKTVRIVPVGSDTQATTNSCFGSG